MGDMKTLREFVKDAEAQLRCNCDLDNWQPEMDTGHSHVCRIDKKARQEYLAQKKAPTNDR